MRRLMLMAMLMLAASIGSAQQQITRFTIDGGGGRSQNARYTLTGTVGQHDAARLLQGGTYRLGAGFWAEVEPGIFSDGFEGDPTARHALGDVAERDD
jgi:hypothetical protein